jgi:putative endonuclease
MAIDLRRRHGQLGERIAAEHLAHRGYTIVARNFRTRYGELDLIAADERSLVFCEVKTRIAGRVAGPDGPLDAIGPRKRKRLRRMATQWLSSSSAEGRPRRQELRFDAIGITLDARGELVRLDHLEGAF